MNIKKLNNKGFVVSTILYTVLIAFLLFLAVTLSIFSSAISTVGSANKDLINASEFKAEQVKVERPSDFVGKWYEDTHDILLKITSEYGLYYWPKDFGLTIKDGVLEAIENRANTGTSYNGKIKVECHEYSDTSCININLEDIKQGEVLRFKVHINGQTKDASIGRW